MRSFSSIKLFALRSWAATVAAVFALFASSVLLFLTPLLGLNMSLSTAGYLSIAAAFVWGARAFFAARPSSDEPQTPNLGSARFASYQELLPLTHRAQNSLVIGWTANDNNTEWPLLYYSGPGHLLTIAPTRSGKGVGSIIPNLLIAKRSVLVIDPKGENAKITARRRRSFGPVYVLDPFEISGEPTAGFNPLALMHAESLDLAEDAATLADALVLDSGDSKETHWNDEAKALIAGVIMYVAAMEPPDARHLDRVRQYLTLPPEDFTGFLREMAASTAARGLIARTGARFLGKTGPEFAGVVSTAQRHTQFLDSPRIASALSRSDFAFADLVEGVASVFVVLPPDRLETYNRWLRLMINAGLRELARSPKKPATPILFLLDEFAALGRLDEVRRGMGLMAGFGVQLWPVLQDLSQLASLYGKSADTFLANAEVLQAFNVQDLESAKTLSERLGDSTLAYRMKSTSTNVSHRSSIFDNRPVTQNTGTSFSTHVQPRRLMKPEEIMQMMEGTQLLFVKGVRPFMAGKVRYFERQEFDGLYDRPEQPAHISCS